MTEKSLATPPRFYKKLWKELGLFWRSGEKLWGVLLSLVTISCMVAATLILGRLNRWQGDVYNAFQNYSLPSFMQQIKIFGVLVFFFILLKALESYCKNRLELSWRRFLTRNYLSFWLSEKRYYWGQLVRGKTDNPDQRISEDTHAFIAHILGLFSSFFQSALMLTVFLGILWHLSGTLSFSVFGLDFNVPGYLVFVALLYTAFGTYITRWFVAPLMPLDYAQEKREGDFRFFMARTREHSASIAGYNAEDRERNVLTKLLQAIITNKNAIIRCMVPINLWMSFYGQIAILLPLVIIAPRYFSEKLSMGFLMQVISAFGAVQGAFNVLEENYPRIMSLKASALRLIHFKEELQRLNRFKKIAPGLHTKKHLLLENLVLTLPPVSCGDDLSDPENPVDSALLTVGHKKIPAGCWTLIQGPSGIGKSTLLRALAGVWAFGSGQILFPKTTAESEGTAGQQASLSPQAITFYKKRNILFLTQETYIPLGTLADALTYPLNQKDFTAQELANTLSFVGLGARADQLFQEKNWPAVLSGGERQRLAFGRLLLARPAWALLDESTSALDSETEKQLYTLLKQKLTKTTVISVGHKESLKEFHDAVWTLKKNN